MFWRRFTVLFLFIAAGLVRGHTVPTITVEAGFGQTREISLTVNLDPRLFLTKQPTSVPPVAASWWLDQDDKARAGNLAAASAYLAKILHFQVGETNFSPSWKITAVDSVSVFPLSAESAEVHLLFEHHGPLPDVPGDFRVTLDDSAPVGLILLNSLDGKAERHPQVIFPGESSRGFKLPAGRPAAVPPPVSVTEVCYDVVPADRASKRHFAGDHLLLALLLGFVPACRFSFSAVMLLLFSLAHLGAALLVIGKWLPHATSWIEAIVWTALAAGVLFLWRRRKWCAAPCFAVAGFCHGLDVPHLHLAVADAVSVLSSTAVLIAVQLSVLFVTLLLMRGPGRGPQRTEP